MTDCFKTEQVLREECQRLSGRLDALSDAEVIAAGDPRTRARSQRNGSSKRKVDTEFDELELRTGAEGTMGTAPDSPTVSAVELAKMSGLLAGLETSLAMSRAEAERRASELTATADELVSTKAQLESLKNSFETCRADLRHWQEIASTAQEKLARSEALQEAAGRQHEAILNAVKEQQARAEDRVRSKLCCCMGFFHWYNIR
ncbi:unnamed protein product [Protopolystoma xenopodis]|uniref:Uncharacterized protein n=1 Tax=Protopolystoma xenopodis TaxID=117903 RepID=A0A3S5FEH4_9PLAT|nr:unnamed protein product [Protopolystoma xenopodis]